MSIDVGFQNYRIGLIVIADGDYYEPRLIEVDRTEDRAIFKAEDFKKGREEKRANLNLELTSRPGGLSWRCSVKGFKSIHGVRVSIRPIPAGKAILPITPGVDVMLEDETSICTSGPYHNFARFAIFEYEGKSLWVYAMESPLKPFKIWVTRLGDNMILDVLSEELGRERTSRYESPLWVLEEVSGWREAVGKYKTWMEKTYGLKPFEERDDLPEWAKKIALYVNVYAHSYTNTIHRTFSEIEDVLTEVAKRFPAENTLVYIAGWDGRPDMTYPDYEPSEEVGGSKGLKRLVDNAHKLGFRIALHCNMWGVGYKSPYYEKFKRYQVKDPEGKPLGWTADHNKDGSRENLFAYISPDYDEFRELLVNRLSLVIKKFGIDAVHLDQTACVLPDFDDPEHDLPGGVRKLIEEIKTRCPDVLIEGEGVNELTVGLTPIYHVWTGTKTPHPVFKELFNSYSKPVGHMDMPSLAYPKRYQKSQELYDALDVIPSLGLNAQYPALVDAGLAEPPSMPSLDCEEAKRVFEKAKRYLQRIET